MRSIFLIFLSLCSSVIAYSQELPLLKVSEDRSFLLTEDDKPFFWLGDTAWELLHRLNKGEIDYYLKNRSEKGFTVIQTVILAELNGLTEANANGALPIVGNDPTKINNDYFEMVEYTIQRAGELGLYIALLPTWGDKFNQKWGVGPEIFTVENANAYGKLLGSRLKSYNNIIWVLGGDRIPESEDHFEIIHAMAKGLKEEDNRHLLTYHPTGSKVASDYFDSEWLDVDMYQSGHSRFSKEYQFVLDKSTVENKRPIINGEARYENIPDRFWEKKDYGWLDDTDARISGYWSIIAGAAGYTYGCNDVWQMYSREREPTIQARTDWSIAIDLPGARQMGFLRDIFEVLPWQSMHYDSTIITSVNPQDQSFSLASMSIDRDIIVAYTPKGNDITLDLSKMEAKEVEAVWFNPRSGFITEIGLFEINGGRSFETWSKGWGSDFILIIYSKQSGLDFSDWNSNRKSRMLGE